MTRWTVAKRRAGTSIIFLLMMVTSKMAPPYIIHELKQMYIWIRSIYIHIYIYILDIRIRPRPHLYSITSVASMSQSSMIPELWFSDLWCSSPDSRHPIVDDKSTKSINFDTILWKLDYIIRNLADFQMTLVNSWDTWKCIKIGSKTSLPGSGSQDRTKARRHGVNVRPRDPEILGTK